MGSDRLKFSYIYTPKMKSWVRHWFTPLVRTVEISGEFKILEGAALFLKLKYHT